MTHQVKCRRGFVTMRETVKMDIDKNCVTVAEMEQGEYADDRIMLMMEHENKDSMALLFSKKDAKAIGETLIRLGSTGSTMKRHTRI